MRRAWVILAALVCGCSGVAAVPGPQVSRPSPASMPAVEGNLYMSDVPAWALLQRQLFDVLDRSAAPLLEKYVRPNGWIKWPPGVVQKGSIDGVDDAYESFHNWPLYYLLGGDAKYLAYSHKEFDAITAQFSQIDTGAGYPMLVKEYQPGYDWMHQGECYVNFYYLTLADPASATTIQRAKRFAGFYLNEDPEALNYDPNFKIIKCTHNGSKGPAYWNFDGRPIWTQDGYGLPFYDIPSCAKVDDLKDANVARLMGQAASARRGKGDCAANLSAAAMVANAYLLTGEAKYKNWVAEYVDAWMARAAANGGVLPDNVGLSGKVGEYIDGKWFGANYGWTWPHGWGNLGQSVTIAGQCALLVTGDRKYLNLPRSQMDMLIGHGVDVGGTLYVPHKHADAGKVNYSPWPWLNVLRVRDGNIVLEFNTGKSPAYEKDGWFEFMPMNSDFAVALWAASADAKDYDRIKKIRDGVKKDFEKVLPVNSKDLSGHDAAWAAYLAGEFPTYPEKIMQLNISQVYGRWKFWREDKQDPNTYPDHYLQARNPITTEGLVQLTMGAPQPVYNGGLLMARVRYFDWANQRPGLPKDVAALVEKMDNEKLTLTLVNVNMTEPRELIVQAGAFGEHQFVEVKYTTNEQGRAVAKTLKVDGKRFFVRLQAASQATLNITQKRFVNPPSYALPW